jgi:hypothetical protein
MARILRDFVTPTPATGSREGVQTLRNEINENINKVQIQLTQFVNTAMAKVQAEADRRADAMAKAQAEADRRADAMLQKLAQMLETAPRNDKDRATPFVRSDVTQGSARQAHAVQGRQQPVRAAQPSWANVTGTGAQTATGWTTVTNIKKKVKKHPLDQRRILFSRNVQTHTCDPRDMMFEVNKALAHARAYATVRLIKMGYTEKGNLTGVMSENACAEDLLEFAPTVMAAVQKLDPEVNDMEKTEKWRKLRVHGVELDRYMGEGRLDVAREEIELMTGERLPYAPRWIKGDTLHERFHSGTIKRSTLVLTVKSKRAADAMLAKGLSFGGRRHEVERFWETGEGGMCMRCCGRDHFGKCAEEAKCFVCAGDHEGMKYQCAVEGCGKKSEPCEHHVAKCVNCKGPHPATSRRCPERWSSKQAHANMSTGMRSSPPETRTQSEQDGPLIDEDPLETNISPPDLQRTTSPRTISISSDINVHQPSSRDQSLPGMTEESYWLRSVTKSFPAATQLHSSDDSNHMSVDDDSAST